MANGEEPDGPERGRTQNHRLFDFLFSWRFLYLLGGAFFVMRLLLDSRFAQSAFVYLLVPFAISVALCLLTKPAPGRSVASRYANHVRDSLIVLLGSSLLLFEGWVCVLFFLPIYYLMVSVGFLYALEVERSQHKRGRTSVHLVPALVLALSLEGVLPAHDEAREERVTATAVVDATPQQLLANLAQPIVFDRPRHWFLSVFPMPDRIEAGSLAPGDVHRIHFTYARWVFTNDLAGTMELRIEEVGPDRVRTRVIANDAYLSHYLDIEGTEIRLRALSPSETEVSLTVSYRRILDPAWYFGGMQRFAVEESARYLIETVVARR